MRKPLGVILAAWIGIGSLGCATNPVAPVALPLPPRPVLPVIKSTDFVPLESNQDWYLIRRTTIMDILERDQLRRGYEEQLEAVIKATH